MKEMEKFEWTNGCEVAVSLTFDDGLASQLNFAVPLLNKLGFKATFYLNPREDYRETLKPWREVSEQGHEIGNHSLTHPCSCNFSFSRNAENCLEKMSLDDIREDILEAHRRITEVIPSGSKTFAYPCYETSVGRGLTKKSYVPIVAGIFVAARSLGERKYANSPLFCDLHELWSWPAERMSAEEMVGLTLRAASENSWAVFTFHGVNEGHLPISEYDLTEFLKFLDKNRNSVWVAPVVEVAEYVIEERRRSGLPV